MPLNTGSVPFVLQCFYKWSFYFPLTEIQRICLFLCHFHLTTKKLLQCILISMGKLISIGPELFACFFLFICLLSSVQFSRSVVFDTLQPHELQHARPPYPSPTPGVYQNLCALSRWCHPTISSSVVPFSSYPQSFPASGSFKWASSSHQVAKVLSFSFNISPSNEHPGSISFRMGWLDLLAVQRTLKVFSKTTVQKHQFFGAQLSL